MLRQFTFFFLLSALTFVVNAEDEIRYYNVEVVLFEHTNPANQQSEDWTQPKKSDVGDQSEIIHQLGQPYVMETKSSFDPKLMFTLVPEKEYQLLEEARKVQESSNRRVLMHTAWRQPGLSREQAIRVYFKHPIEKIGSMHTQAGSTQPGSMPLPGHVMTSKPYLEGSIKVMLSRYLHVDTDILYFATVPETNAVENTDTGLENASNAEYNENGIQLSVYQMKQLRRRIRSKELHYLDHPVLGMLLMITPYELPEQTEKTNTAPKSYRTLPR